MFEATYNNEYGQIWTVNILAKSWEEAGMYAEREEDDEWKLSYLTRLTW